ncbi:MAG: FKBP-type peptidylprolyl isomerase [Bacteroidota bacterium]
MKNVFKVVFLVVLTGLVVSCNKNDDPEIVPLRDYTVQYASDIEAIKTFLKTHKLPSAALNPNTMQHLDFGPSIPELDPTSIWGTDATTPNANLLHWDVEKDNITYTIYYLQLQQGSATTSKSPCNLDGILAAYEGQLLDGTVFDSDFYPQSYFNLNGVIRGWSEIFPKFKSGSYVSNPDGTIDYSNFGAGIMFIPSGLAYYSNSPSSIPSYSPLIFSFKLYEVQRIDNDGDGVYSFQEDINGDGYIRDNETTFEDDTDHDGIPNALDVDDDGDNYLTKEEIRYTKLGNTYYYPYEGALVNDPSTPQDETLGIPRAFTGPIAAPVPPATTGLPMPGPSDFTDPLRLRRHLDATAKPPYYDQ